MPVKKGGHLIRGNDLKRFWSKTKSGLGGCILWTGSTSKYGYGKFMTGPLRGQTTHVAHRWLYEQVLGTVGSKFLLHSCDTPACIALQHLTPGTQLQNQQDAVNKDRKARGERHPKAKLTADQVAMVRREIAAGRRGVDLARELGVLPSTISAIIKGRNWRRS